MRAALPSVAPVFFFGGGKTDAWGAVTWLSTRLGREGPGAAWAPPPPGPACGLTVAKPRHDPRRNLPPTPPPAFGLTVVEAMTCGLPTFATNHGGPAEIIKHKKSGGKRGGWGRGILAPPTKGQRRSEGGLGGGGQSSAVLGCDGSLSLPGEGRLHPSFAVNASRRTLVLARAPCVA